MLLLGLAAEAPARDGVPAPEAPVFETSVKPFLARTCYLCHNARLKNGGLDLEGNSTPAAIARDPHTWERVALKVRTGEMPPKEWPRPSEAERTALMRWIDEELARADEAAPPDAGRVTARRLNRTEYNNTVRDLLGVTIRPADDFPQDDAGYGFDNIGDVLSLSPVLMEKYLSAAEKVAQAALFGPPESKPSLLRLQPRGGKIEPSPIPLFDYDLDGLSTAERPPRDSSLPGRGGLQDPGRARRLSARRLRAPPGGSLDRRPEGERARAGSRGRRHFRGAIGRSFRDKGREFQVRLPAGEHWLAAAILRLYEGLPTSYGGPNPSRRPEPPPRVFKPPKDATPERIEELRKTVRGQERGETAGQRGPRQSPRGGRSLRAREGPFGREPGAASTPAAISTAATTAGAARQILTRLARRAYRRPVTPTDVDPLLRLATAARKRGDSFEQARALALQAILVSPDFLFRIEKDAKADGHRAGQPVTGHELASRLSYFLWSSMPDDELLRAAERGDAAPARGPGRRRCGAC